MIWSNNDQWMLTGDHSGFVKYWQTNMNNVKMYQAHKEPIRGLRWDHVIMDIFLIWKGRRKQFLADLERAESLASIMLFIIYYISKALFCFQICVFIYSFRFELTRFHGYQNFKIRCKIASSKISFRCFNKTCFLYGT